MFGKYRARRRIKRIARELVENASLTARYREAIARLPPGKEIWELDPLDPDVENALMVFEDIHEVIRGIDPDLSQMDLHDVAVFFAALALEKQSVARAGAAKPGQSERGR